MAGRRQWLVPVAFASFIFAVAMVYITHGPPSNRPPQTPSRLKRSARNATDKLYIAVIDREFHPSAIQCRLKESWIDSALSLDFIDGVELYSHLSFRNPDCGFASLEVPLPSSGFRPLHNPSCHITRSVFRVFLDRSDAGWLLLLSDGSFVNTHALPSLLKSLQKRSPLDIPLVRGQCSEIRDYFQTFAKNSGVLVSRKAAAQLAQTDLTWDVACEVEIDGSESLSHAMDINGLFALFNHDTRFLGQPYVSESDYDALLRHDYSKLPVCPRDYQSVRVCHATVQPMNKLIVWGGEGKECNKERFVGNAKAMFEGIPDNVKFMYQTYEAKLCVT
jgi:hypothetical protein